MFRKGSFTTCICFSKIVKVSYNEFGINPLYCVSLHRYIWQGGLKYTEKNLQKLQDKDLM